MIAKEPRLLRVGVLGCGPIAQFAHFDACRKARNVELYAICDRADDLRARMAAIHQPRATHAEYQAMLADAQVEAVIIAVADEFHASAVTQALEAGKHVLVEKPLATTVRSCRSLVELAARRGLAGQVGNNRRFDPGLAFARDFVQQDLGPRIMLSAWYHDSTLRYSMTDALAQIVVTSQQALRPADDARIDRPRYLLRAHGSHLVDTAQVLGGTIAAVRARRLERAEAFCWSVEVCFSDGGLGHLALLVPARGDFEEGFEVQGANGSVQGRLGHPWFHKAGYVECFDARLGQYRRVLGEDAHTYKLQLEAFAATILDGAPQRGASFAEGLAAVAALGAISRSVETGNLERLDAMSGEI